MDPKTLLFYVFGAITVLSAGLVVTVRNPVQAALWLVLSFFSTACIWMLLKAEFLAITLVLVYVGAVMVLFLFVVMMLDIDLDKARAGFWKHRAVASVVGSLVMLELFFVLWPNFNTVRIADAPNVPAGFSNTKILGGLMYTQYVYPFEIAAVILLVAIIAAIALTLRGRKDTKYNDPSAAVRVKSGDRLRVVKMASEPKVVAPAVVNPAAPAPAPAPNPAAPSTAAPAAPAAGAPK